MSSGPKLSGERDLAGLRPSPPVARAPASSADGEPRARAKGYLALIVVQLAFGLFAIFGKWAFADFTPEAIVAWRIAAGAVVLGAAVAWLQGRRALPSRADLIRLAVLALLGVSLNMALYLEGLKRSTAINAGLILPMIPVFTYLIALFVRHERFAWSRGIGILIALSATLALALGRGAGFTESTRTGNLLMVANALCYSLYLVHSRPLVARYGPLCVTAWVFVLSLWAVPLLAAKVDCLPDHAAAKSWQSLAYIVVFPTLVAYFFNAYALARVAASTAAVFIFFQSLITVAGAVVLLGETLDPRTLACGALVFGGTALVLFGPQREGAR